MAFQTSQPSTMPRKPSSYIVSTRLASALMGHQPPYEASKSIELLHAYFQYFSGKSEGVPTVAYSEKKSLERLKKFHPMAIEFFSNTNHSAGSRVWRNDESLDRFFTCNAEVGQREFKLPISSTNPKHPGYILLAGYTLPLIDHRVTMPDPINPKSSGLTADSYTQAWASEARFVRARADENAKRKLQNLTPLPPLKREYKDLPPFSGAMKVHIARDEQNLDEMDNRPIPDYWVSQLHFVNAVQRKVVNDFGLPSKYENRLRIGLFSTKGDRGHLYCVPYDQMLEAELFKRLEVFFKCVNDGISPSSPRVKKNFDYYRVEDVQKNLQILPKNIELMADKALGQMHLIDKDKKALNEKSLGFQKVLDHIYTEYTQGKGDVILLPGGRTLQQSDPDNKVDVGLIAQAMRRAVHLQESVERLYKTIQKHESQNIDLAMICNQLEDMLTTHALDRSLLESVIERDFSQAHDVDERPLTQITKTKDSRIYDQLAARRDADSETKSYPDVQAV